MECLSTGLKYYDFYYEAYTAILSGLVGEYEIEVEDELSETGKRWERKYGIKAFSPFAKGFYYREYDDFGAGRSYGFNRVHLGHDMIGSVGTPIVAVESGTIEELGWNQYGGWRVGIRTHDKKRYYYYAHFRKDFPYNKDLKIGDEVQAGDVIGYLGRTGYSIKENVNNIDVAHLHIGLQLIFDESQKNCKSEIWIDVFPITKLLAKNRSAVIKNTETKEYSRVYGFREILED
jgi:murein DD-endopeptidase MepM/ murein hydrolase activator NlpD